jgi:type IV pilus assembly protein PilM
LDVQEKLEAIIEGIKDQLNLGAKQVIGVDIGLHSVKVAELQALSDGNFKLMRYASVNLPEAALIEDEVQKEDEIVEALVEAIDKSKTTLKQACLGLSGPNTIARRLQLVGGDEEEIRDQVSWEAEQYLPFGLHESSVSFHTIGENEGGGVDVIVAAARNDVMNAFRDICTKAKLKVKIVDLSVIALVNVFEHLISSKTINANSSYILIDLGAQKTHFVIYKNGMIVFAKEMTIGCVMITEEIQRQLGVNYNEAEDLKISGDANGNLPEEILEIVDDVVESFFSEIKKTIDFYVSSTQDESLSGCYITGGGTLIPGLIEGLEALMGLSVTILNPFEKFSYDTRKFSEAEINEIAYKGVVAIGLAMRHRK